MEKDRSKTIVARNGLQLVVVACLLALTSSNRIFLGSSNSPKSVSAVDFQKYTELKPQQWLKLRGGASKNSKKKTKKDAAVVKVNDDGTNPAEKNKKVKTDKKSSVKEKKKGPVRLQDLKEEENEESMDMEDNTAFVETKEPSSPLKMLNSFIEIFDKTPPMTRYFLAASFVITGLSSLFNKNQWPSFLHFQWTPILFQFQWWRVVSAFLYFGPFDLFYPLTLQFVWQHMGQLERLSSRTPEDFFVMTIFGAAALIFLYPLLGISMKFLGHNLATYYVYIWARTFEGSDVNFMDLFTLKAEIMPWFFCLQTYLLEQEIPFADLMGIAVGHIYYYLRNKNILKIPEGIQTWFRTPVMRQAYMKFYDTLE